jgi:hypothetical protein
MINNIDNIELLKIGDKILEIIDDRLFDEIPRGDLQGIIEAQIISAYYLGLEHGDKLIAKNLPY